MDYTKQAMALHEYKRKRDFRKTPEPKTSTKKSAAIFVVQKHDATHLHYDFRLHINRTLKSWAVPKGPSLNPDEKRLAIETEDHPLDYADFEGIIPEGNYGAGTVMIWDYGTYETSEGTPAASLKNGHLHLILHGKKLKGAFSLIKSGRERQWLLIKKDDEHASYDDITKTKPKSAKTNRTLSQITKHQ